MVSKEGLKEQRRQNSGVDGYQHVISSNVGSDIKEQWAFEKERTFYSGHAREELGIEPVSNLDEANLKPCLYDSIKKVYDDIGPLQCHTIPILSQERALRLIVKAPTGTGKTAAFLIPAIQTALVSKESRGGHPLVLILSNTSNLSLQTMRMACQLAGYSDTGYSETGVSIAGLFSGTKQRYREIYHDIVVATTGKLLMVLNSENYVTKIDLSHLRMLIIDEFDYMIDASRFGLEIKEIFEKIPSDIKANIKIGMFSATLEDKVIHDNKDILNMLLKMPTDSEECETDALCNVTQIVVPAMPGHIIQRIFKIARAGSLIGVPDKDKFMEQVQRHSFTQRLVALLALLDADYPNNNLIGGRVAKKKTIIFAEKKVTCNYLATFLMRMGYSFLPVNSDYTGSTVDKVLDKLNKCEIHGVVATNKLSRGQDIPEVDHVIVFEMSAMFADYQHRIGRTGRAGRGGKSTVLFREDRDEKHIDPLVKFLNYHGQDVPAWLYDLSSFSELCPRQLRANLDDSSHYVEDNEDESGMDEVQNVHLFADDMDEVQNVNLDSEEDPNTPYDDVNENSSDHSYTSEYINSDDDNLTVDM